MSDLSDNTGIWSLAQNVTASNLGGYNNVNGVKVPLVSSNTDTQGNTPVTHPPLPNHLNDFEGSINLN